MNITIFSGNAYIFAAVQQAAAKKDIRVILNGTYVERIGERHAPAGSVIVATDGRALTAVRDPDAYIEVSGVGVVIPYVKLPASLGKVTTKRAPATLKVTAEPTQIETGPWLVSLYVDDELTYSSVITAKDVELVSGLRYPDWRRVLDQDPAPAQGPTSMRIAPHFLARGALIEQAYGRRAGVQDISGTVSEMQDTARTVWASKDGVVDAVQVAMGYRHDVKNPSMPAWSALA